MQFDERQFRKFLSEQDISDILDELAAAINKDYGINDKVLLVGVLKGAVVVTADLVRRLHSDVDVDFVRCAAFGKSLNGSGTITLLRDISVDVRDRHVIIVEEIIDSGRTLKFLFERLQSSGPASVEIVTLLDKENRRVVDVPVKYVGRTISDQFLVGYGLDLEEKARNLPEIYALKYPN